MTGFQHRIILVVISFVCFIFCNETLRASSQNIHVWDMQEITFTAENDYENPYTEVTCWVELRDPDFQSAFTDFGTAVKHSKSALSPPNPVNGTGRAAPISPMITGSTGDPAY